MRQWVRAGALSRARLIALGLCVALLGGAPSLATTPVVKGETRVSTNQGFARILLHLAEEVESEVKVAGGIIVVSFKRPVHVPIERVSAEAGEYVSAARRDPDGKGLRIALRHKVTVNSMAAGERLFIDLLPENWKGMAPGLPHEVIEDLARRAREAEKQLRQQRQTAQQNQPINARVRVASQPTFTRFVFELPELVPVTSDRNKDNLTVTFAAAVKFDLADAKLSLPPLVRSLDAEDNQDSVSVHFAFSGKADIRTFREDNNYVVDVGAADAKETAVPPAQRIAEAVKSQFAKSVSPAGLEAPQTVPARGGTSEKPDEPAKQAAPAPAAAQPEAPKQAAAPQVPPSEAAQRSAPAAPVQQEATPPPAPQAAATQNAASQPAPLDAPAAPSAPQLAPAAASADKPVTQAKADDAVRSRTDRIVAELRRQGDDLRLIFPFAEATPAAVFRRGDTLWLVFDSKTPLDLAALNGDSSRTIRSVSASASRNGQIVRVALERPRLVSAAAEAGLWTIVIGDAVTEPTQPLAIARNITGPSRASVTVPFEQPKNLHRITDPDIGDTLMVVTALEPARGFLKGQDFVEFRALPSTHGVVVQPIADDVHAEIAADKILIGRPGGLTLSGLTQAAPRSTSASFHPTVFDSQLWGFDRQANFIERQYKLIAAAAEASESKRLGPRLELARFYLSRDMFPEAKGVLDVTLDDDRPNAEDPTALVLRAITEIMLNRPEEGLKDLSNPVIGDQHDAPLWRAFALARQGKWADAREGFKKVETAISTLPLELQRMALKESLKAAIELKDFSAAAEELNEFETVGVTRKLEPTIRLLSARVAQGLGRREDALKNYRAAAESDDRPAAAEARLREILMRYGLGDFKRIDVISELETLTTLWRGDDTEIEALQLLARLYTEESRHRDAFYVMRTAMTAHPNSEMTRRIHDEAAASFDSLFLAGKGDALPAIEALSMFYDFRELTPIGRRGDEMIRRLAERLVSVDLLKQAAELLQHQVDNRLQGAARAQVATRLAVIYLMDHKPERTQAVLKATRMGDLPADIRHLRLMLEARALSNMGRHDVALEAIANIERREAIRLRSDILWAAKRHTEAAEQIELLYGERWKEWQPLSDVERADILRAAVGYTLGGDDIGIGRLKEKYASKMNEGTDKRMFEIATSSAGQNDTEFREIAKSVAAGNTLETFLREMRAAFPEMGPQAAGERATPGLLRTAGGGQ